MLIFRELIGFSSPTDSCNIVVLKCRVSYTTWDDDNSEIFNSFKGTVQPFKLKGVTRLIRSAVKHWRSGNFLKSF